MNVFTSLKEIFNSPIFSINQTPVTLLSIASFVLILIGFLVLSRMVRSRLLAKLLSLSNIDEGLQFNLIRITQYCIIFVGVIIAFQFIGIDLSGLAVVLGFLSVGIGFGLQNITSNFISGLILLFERPISVGDRVTVGDNEGDVVNINIRSTTIRTVNNITIIVPNSDFISNSVINWSHSDKKIRVDLEIGVSYNSDIDKVLQVLIEAAEDNEEVLKTPKPEAHLKSFGDSSWNMQLRVWIANPKRYYYVRAALNCELVKKFRSNGIEIPFPQRDLHVKSINHDITNTIFNNR